jgi:predicted MPP superfamily phosphohydrolase
VVRRVELRPPRWPAALDGVRIALLSDLHAGLGHMTQERVEAIVARAAAERPDLVCLAGDFLDSTLFGRGRVAPSAVAAAFADLDAPLGAWAVLGNHDWRAAGATLRRALERAGVRVLENAAAEARDGDRSLWIAGLADLRERRPDIPLSLLVVPADAPVVLLTHDPDVFPHVPDRVSLTLAGHTHGGQVNLPLLRRVAAPSRHGERYLSGHVVEYGRHLFVSSGLGTAGLPLRLRQPPEIVVLTLRSG